MKIINEDGKIFGKINIFDLICIFLFLLLLLTAYRYIILKDWPQTPQLSKEIPKENMIVIIEFNETNERLNNQMYVGLNYVYQDDSSFEVIDKKTTKNKIEEFNGTLETRMNLTKNNEHLLLNEEIVNINKKIKLTTEKISVDGIVVDMFKPPIFNPLN